MPNYTTNKRRKRGGPGHKKKGGNVFKKTKRAVKKATRSVARRRRPMVTPTFPNQRTTVIRNLMPNAKRGGNIFHGIHKLQHTLHHASGPLAVGLAAGAIASGQYELLPFIAAGTQIAKIQDQ